MCVTKRNLSVATKNKMFLPWQQKQSIQSYIKEKFKTSFKSIRERLSDMIDNLIGYDH